MGTTLPHCADVLFMVGRSHRCHRLELPPSVALKKNREEEAAQAKELQKRQVEEKKRKDELEKRMLALNSQLRTRLGGMDRPSSAPGDEEEEEKEEEEETKAERGGFRGPCSSCYS